MIVQFNRAGALGDVILLTGIVREYKTRNPNDEIIVSTKSPEAFINNPYITNKLIKPDRIIDFDLCYEKKPNIHRIKAYSELALGTSEIFIPELYCGIDEKELHKKLPIGIKDYIVVHMTRSWENRTWPLDNYLKVIKELSTIYPIIVVGRGGDFHPGLMKNVFDYVNQTTLPQLRTILENAKLLLAFDSGVLTVAQTTSVKCVGLFTIANPEYVLFNSTVTPIIPDIECKFCLHKQSPPITYLGCPSNINYSCLGTISVDRVIRVCTGLLKVTI